MISVVLATYNGARFLREQFLSIITQLTFDDEIIVCDDGSVDETMDLIETFKATYGSRLRFVVIKNNRRGIVGNFESGLSVCQGEFVFLSDQDDIWKEDKVARILVVLRHATLVISDCELVNEYGQQISGSFFQVNGSRPGLIHNFIRNGYLGCCMAFRKDLLRNALPIPMLAGMHDIWLGLIAQLTGRVIFLEDNLVYYRRHENNASSTGKKSQNRMTTKILLRARLFLGLTLRSCRILRSILSVQFVKKVFR